MNPDSQKVPTPAIPPATPTAVGSSAGSNGSAHQQTPPPVAATAADDVLLHQAVEQARLAITRNQNDPYQQVQDMEMVKSRYVALRYGITLKLSGD